MISKQKIGLIIIAGLFIIFAGMNVSRLIPETQNYKVYSEALGKYNNNELSESYHLFGRVSRFSKLKPAAIYRQALCAEKLSDTKTELKKYKEVIKYYPSSVLSLRSKYQRAQRYYEGKNYKKAKKEFKNILDRYPNSDYAAASQYYLGSIEAEKIPRIKSKKKKAKAQKIAVKYFKAYLKAAPTGRFARYCIAKWLELGTKLNNEDNLLIAKVYQENQDYKNAQKYLKFTNLSVSWPYFVQTAYSMKDYSKVKYYTEQGLRGRGSEEILINEDIDDKDENKNIYDAIDKYLDVSNDPKTSISYLLSISKKAKGYDYLLYRNCKNMPDASQPACFNSLFYQYPDGQFAAEALANMFYSKVETQNYFVAKKLGKMHLAKFPKSNSAPRVMFWLAKVSERTKNYDSARSYYRSLIHQFPDDYYAYHAFLNLNRLRRFPSIELHQKPVEFPYKNSGYVLITELAKVKDYGLISQLYKEDEFIQSWLAYLEGDFSASARIARDAMEELPQKPDRKDLRWRLVYPIHYYDEITQSAQAWNNDPILILSIIREESYFNPKAKSFVGARGLMQLMPATATEASNIGGISLPNQDLLFDPYMNIKLGNIYYSRLKSSLRSKDIMAVLAYNGGIGSVSKWKDSLNYVDVNDFVEQIPYAETQNYLKKVFRSYWNYLRTYDAINF